MTIEFDVNGIGECPKCGGMVGHYDRHCGKCGTVLPFPATFEKLDMQLFCDDHFGCEHFDEKTIMRNNFCSKCGKKLD